MRISAAAAGAEIAATAAAAQSKVEILFMIALNGSVSLGSFVCLAACCRYCVHATVTGELDIGKWNPTSDVNSCNI
jgi:hypothetical protein